MCCSVHYSEGERNCLARADGYPDSIYVHNCVTFLPPASQLLAPRCQMCDTALSRESSSPFSGNITQLSGPTPSKISKNSDPHKHTRTRTGHTHRMLSRPLEYSTRAHRLHRRLHRHPRRRRPHRPLLHRHRPSPPPPSPPPLPPPKLYRHRIPDPETAGDRREVNKDLNSDAGCCERNSGVVRQRGTLSPTVTNKKH